MDILHSKRKLIALRTNECCKWGVLPIIFVLLVVIPIQIDQAIPYPTQEITNVSSIFDQTQADNEPNFVIAYGKNSKNFLQDDN